MNLKRVPKFMCMALVCLAISASAQAKDYVIAVSPIQSTEAIKTRVKHIIGFLVGLEPGDTAHLMDGYNVQSLGTFTVPTDKRYQHPKTRITMNAKSMAGFLRFNQRAMAASDLGIPENSVRLPQLLHALPDVVGKAENVQIIVFGGARYADPFEANASMLNNLFPGDGHLGATRAASPYGTADLKGALEGAQLHMIISDEDALKQHRLGYYIQRFWTLYMNELGASLVSFSSDANIVLANAQKGLTARPHSFTKQADVKLEMIQATPPSVQKTIFERPISTIALTRQEILRAQNVEVGISWNAEVDLDLHIRPMPGSQTLYYGHNRTPQGQYWKDYTSGRGMNGYETISFHVPLDMRAIVTGVNFFSGTSKGGVSGEIRVSVNGKTYKQEFHIPAEHGSSDGIHNTMRHNRAMGKNNILIKLIDVVKGSSA